jgi:hypothetical protein
MTSDALETMRSKRQRLQVIDDEYVEVPEAAVDADDDADL